MGLSQPPHAHSSATDKQNETSEMLIDVLKQDRHQPFNVELTVGDAEDELQGRMMRPMNLTFTLFGSLHKL